MLKENIDSLTDQLVMQHNHNHHSHNHHHHHSHLEGNDLTHHHLTQELITLTHQVEELQHKLKLSKDLVSNLVQEKETEHKHLQKISSVFQSSASVTNGIGTGELETPDNIGEEVCEEALNYSEKEEQKQQTRHLPSHEEGIKKRLKLMN